MYGGERDGGGQEETEKTANGWHFPEQASQEANPRQTRGPGRVSAEHGAVTAVSGHGCPFAAESHGPRCVLFTMLHHTASVYKGLV